MVAITNDEKEFTKKPFKRGVTTNAIFFSCIAAHVVGEGGLYGTRGIEIKRDIICKIPNKYMMFSTSIYTYWTKLSLRYYNKFRSYTVNKS